MTALAKLELAEHELRMTCEFLAKMQACQTHVTTQADMVHPFRKDMRYKFIINSLDSSIMFARVLERENEETVARLRRSLQGAAS